MPRIPLILIPSPLVWASSYRWIAKVLRKTGYSLHIPNLPGTVGGLKLRQPWNFEDYADWLTRYIEQLHLEGPAILIGHSNSAPIVGLLALRKLPIRAIVLHTPTGAREHSYVQVLVGRAIDALLEFELTISKGHHVLLNLLLHTRNFLHQVRLAIRCDERRIYREIKVPILLALGRHDHTMPPRDWPLLEEAMPRARVYVSERGAHDWMITERNEFLELLDNWIRSLPELE